MVQDSAVPFVSTAERARLPIVPPSSGMRVVVGRIRPDASAVEVALEIGAATEEGVQASGPSLVETNPTTTTTTMMMMMTPPRVVDAIAAKEGADQGGMMIDD